MLYFHFVKQTQALKQFFLILICFFVVSSCSYFEQKENGNESLNEVDTIIDFTSVDTYPLFPLCDSIQSEEKQWICSQIKLSEHIKANLVKYHLKVNDNLNDTILLNLRIDTLGAVYLTKLNASDILKTKIPALDSIVNLSLNNLPNLKPAIKRGIPVNSEFKLPIILKNKD